MKTATLRLAAPVLCSALVPAAMAGTIALYTFEDGGTVGTAVSTIQNAANPGAYTATGIRLGTDADGWGDAPCWTNNFPGNCVWSDASCTQMLARAPMAAHIAKNANAKLGGALDMSGLASALYATNSFTVEFFWRQGEVVKPGVIMSMIHGYILNVGSSSQYQTYVQMDGNAGTSLQTKIHCGESTDDRHLHKYGWRHWAVTFDKATATATLWFDYENYGSLSGGFDFRTSTSGDFRFGSRRYSDKPLQGYNGASGEISCIRVSDGVLGVGDFMRMGVAAYYPMKDAASGVTATTVTNALVTGDSDGAAGSIDSDVAPIFSDDAPGRYVFSSFAKDALLCDGPGSLSFAGKGYVSLAGLAGRIAMLTHESSGATFECFFKKEESGGNKNLLSFAPDGANYWRAYADTQSAVSKQDNRYSVSAGTEGETLSDDGRWHHLAVVFDANASEAKHWKSATVYIDYAQPTNATLANGVYWKQEDYWNAWSDLPFVVGLRADLTEASGNRGFVGKISSVRVTSKALTPDRFMVASDTASAPSANAGFRWRFEDGAVGSTVGTAADSASGEKWAIGEVTTYGTGWTAPAYSARRASRTLKIGDDEFDNRRSAAFAQGAASTRAILETKTWCGAPPLHPRSWTMELFVRADATPSSDALLAGRGRLNPTTGAEWSDWSLALQPDGKLALAGFRDDGASGKTAWSFANLGSGAADGKWHRIEVVHDGAVSSIHVWLDDAKVLDETLASALIGTANARYQFGAGCGLDAFAGDIDEVRFVGRALSPAEFAAAMSDATVFFIR